jgi:hypothetical protein
MRRFELLLLLKCGFESAEIAAFPASDIRLRTKCGPRDLSNLRAELSMAKFLASLFEDTLG